MDLPRARFHASNSRRSPLPWSRLALLMVKPRMW